MKLILIFDVADNVADFKYEIDKKTVRSEATAEPEEGPSAISY